MFILSEESILSVRKRIKNIITFFSILIGLVLFSHSVIPHDHHFDIFDKHDAHHNDNSSEDNQAHCFYFNNVVIQKSFSSSKIVLKKNIKANSFVLTNIIKHEALYHSKNLIDDYYYYPVNKILLSSSPTRGSPSFVS